MIKYCYDQWNKNKYMLEAALRETDISRVEYKDLLVLTVENILNDDDYGPKWNTEGITEIDDGSYQGTLLYLIPEDDYQPSEWQYLMTYVGYGSCSYCDLLQSIQPYSQEETDDDDIKNFMSLCKDLVTNMIKPYNYGWRNKEEFEHVTMEETE